MSKPHKNLKDYDGRAFCFDEVMPPEGKYAIYDRNGDIRYRKKRAISASKLKNKIGNNSQISDKSTIPPTPITTNITFINNYWNVANNYHTHITNINTFMNIFSAKFFQKYAFYPSLKDITTFRNFLELNYGSCPPWMIMENFMASYIPEFSMSQLPFQPSADRRFLPS